MLQGFLAIDLPAVAVSADEEDLCQHVVEILQVLTPRIMRWSDTTWILDLTVCASYWMAQAAAKQKDVLTLVRSHLSGMASRLMAVRLDNDLAVAEQGSLGLWHAAVAPHPWQALLLVRQMRERQLEGFVSMGGGAEQDAARGELARSLYRGVSWDVFWLLVEELALHWQELSISKPQETSPVSQTAYGVSRRFSVATFRRQRSQMQQAVKRLALRVPFDLKSLSELAVKRRFGSALSEIWRWTFDATVSPEDFGVWRSFVTKAKPQVTRHLDHALCEWSHIAPFLQEDFDRLCDLASWHVGEKVVSLEWRLVLHDLSYHVIPIRFRHPHPLHLERGAHSTALLQALYSFERFVPCSESQGLDCAANLWSIIAWNITVTEKITVAPRTVGLFGDQQSLLGCDLLSLLQLENKASVALEAYSLNQDWVPEDSFQSISMDRSSDMQLEKVFMAIADHRPLFLYHQPVPLSSVVDRTTSLVWKFQERTMDKWWSNHRGDSGQMQRDYYRLSDKKGRSYWVFNDVEKGWRAHGIFG